MISHSVTNKDPPLIHSSVCLQNLLLKVKVTSVVSFINNVLRIGTYHKIFKNIFVVVLFERIFDLIYN